jgi:hypothetical protein
VYVLHLGRVAPGARRSRAQNKMGTNELALASQRCRARLYSHKATSTGCREQLPSAEMAKGHGAARRPCAAWQQKSWAPTHFPPQPPAPVLACAEVHQQTELRRRLLGRRQLQLGYWGCRQQRRQRAPRCSAGASGTASLQSATSETCSALGLKRMQNTLLRGCKRAYGIFWLATGSG